MKSILIILLFSILFTYGSKIDFCDKKICGDKIHICCGFNDKFSKNCPKTIQMFDIRPSAAELMITKHNEIRQLIASGNHDNFEKAARIPEIRWNDDLAYTAVCHVKTCMNGFDMCRNTLISRNVSQNIYRESNFTLTTIENLFSRAFNKWNKEAKIASLAHISKFIGSPNIGNFTQIIHETAYKMGCAAAWWTEFDKYEFEVVCNYNAGNSRGRKVYLAGDLKCTTGTSPKYPHLCSVDEPPVMQNCSLAFLK